ncbi:DUF2273 domain-containing protein [Enterococcus mediterraneensis]|uniref:DUF2273 domain-containing protein n=1 Tax=Enterococcus mediterraneensis TaxID=2364791 RepID=UPI000F046545|nr:DUF2273 domain-containing protein [Enterococcus mediterraneensis]
MKDLLLDYKLPIIGGGIGLVLAILLLTIGFFKTLLLLIITFLGAAIGMYVKNHGLLDNYLNNK